MTILTFLAHLLNFCAPAIWMAGAATLCGGLVVPARGMRWPRRMACGVAVGLAVLAVGLLWSGSDGRMATWGALVAAVAACEYLLRRGPLR